VRQTPHTEIIPPQLKGKDNTTKERKTSINGKIQQENGRRKPVREIHMIHALARMNHIRCVRKRKRKSLVSIGHTCIEEKGVVACLGLG
jgi:hypothetical protein